MNYNNINEQEFSNFSQNGEDGIIEFLSNKIENNNKYFVEIGCGNGLENNSTNLVLNNWSGIVCDIPPNINLYKRLLKIIQPKKEIQHVSGIISLKNINELTNIIKNQDISFLSLDIDSYDFFIMLEILKLGIFAKIVCVEYNSFFGKEPLSVKYIENFKRNSIDDKRGLYFGASLQAWKILFKKYDYKFVCVDKNGVNAFFVLPKYFEKNLFDNCGLNFQYSKIHERIYKSEGRTIKDDFLRKFRNKLININELI